MNKRLGCLTGAVLALLSMGAIAGAGEGGSDDDHDAMVFFGFVKDTRGAPVADANALAKVKNGVTFSVRTGATGSYRFPLFNKKANPEDIVISCEKQGYKQVRVSRRPPVTKPDGAVTIETECRLERG